MHAQLRRLHDQYACVFSKTVYELRPLQEVEAWLRRCHQAGWQLQQLPSPIQNLQLRGKILHHLAICV